jgi:hypothetical protein
VHRWRRCCLRIEARERTFDADEGRQRRAALS